MMILFISFAGVCTVDAATVMAKNGQTESSFTGIAKDSDTGTWQYIKNGAWDRSFTGIAKSSYDGKNYFVRKGVVDFTFTGVAKNPVTKTWDYCRRGRADYSYSGAAKSILNGEYYYVKKGRVDFTFTGLCYSPDHKTYIFVKKGRYKPDYSGPSISADNSKYYQVKNGKWAKDASGTYKTKYNDYVYTKGRILQSPLYYSGQHFYVKKNGVKAAYGVGKALNGKWYFTDPNTGLLYKKQGFFEYNGKKYYCKADGTLMADQIFQVDGKWYGATANASLAKNGWVKAGKLYYNFNNYEVEDTCIMAKKVMDQNSYDLRTMFFWSATKLPYFSFKYNKNWGTKWFADYGFVKGRGNCYVIAATFYYFAKMLGYDAHQVSGTVYLDHSWVEIDIDGKTYVYDPEVYTEAKIVRYGLQYGHYELRNYHNYSRMN